MRFAGKAASVLLLGWLTVHAPAAAQNGLRHTQLRGVASSRVFGNINRNDARAALKVWFDTLGQQKGYVLDSTVDILDTTLEIRERLQSNSVELLTLGFIDYLELESNTLISPVLTDARTSGTTLYPYVLLVNSSSVASIAGLRGKNLLLYGRGSGETAVVWLEVLLNKEGLPRATSFFGSIKTLSKPQSCILPVFFGTADACVVDEVDLNLAREMNPQLGQLRAIARSRPMVESIIAVPVDPHPRQKELIEDMLSLHQDPRGRQLLMVFKTERMVRIQPGDLDGGRELWRDFRRLPGASPNRPIGFLGIPDTDGAGRGGH